MWQRSALPRARHEDLVVKDLNDEILVYDRDGDSAHCLGPVAAMVWKACDGTTRVDAMAERLGGDDALGRVSDALTELKTRGLLDGAPEPERDREGLSRRQAMYRLAGAAVSAPMIVSVMAPMARAAGSCSGPQLGGTCVGGPGLGNCCQNLNDLACQASSTCCIRPGGQTCATVADCCGGAAFALCSGGGTCCSKSGGFCTNAGQCCGGGGTNNACTGNACCRISGATCNATFTCCAGLTCSGGSCVA